MRKGCAEILCESSSEIFATITVRTALLAVTEVEPLLQPRVFPALKTSYNEHAAT
jgi:hypothetical protein